MCICSNVSVKSDARHNYKIIVKVKFFLYTVRAGMRLYNAFILGTVISDKKRKKEAECRILRFWFIMKFSDHFLFPYFF